MIAALLFAATLATADSLPRTAAPDSSAAAAVDSSHAAPRVVRRFPPIEVQAPAYDLASVQTVHGIEANVLRALPVDDVAGALALQAGVVAQGEELHVRGGRSGETATVLDGIGLNEPLRFRALAVPLLALRTADLVSGAPDARYASGLAGVVNLHTIDPGPRPTGELRWQTDGGTDTRYDRVSGLAAAPLGVLGLGVVTAMDGLFDDTTLPSQRTPSRHDVGGLSLGWRAENRMLGYVKLAPVEQPRRFDAQVLVSRQLHRPWDPEWSLDGWTFVPANPKNTPTFSPVPLPGYQPYNAADHLGITDDRSIVAQVGVSTGRDAWRATLGLGWVHTATITSIDGHYDPSRNWIRPAYGDARSTDEFHVLWGDYPLQRSSRSDVLTLRGDGELARHDLSLKAGAGVTYEEVALDEVQLFPLGWDINGDPMTPLDSLRSYRAWAPGGFAYVQGRWRSGDLILNGGLRAEYFTPGPQADRQSLPGTSRGIVSWSPRLGIAYPISVRDAFSLAYARIQQDPSRDFLYDSRTVIADRQPLGNPLLAPATLVSYQAAVKHLLDTSWSFQTAVFFRDLFGLIGPRDLAPPGGATNLTYDDVDQGHALGFEWSLLGVGREGRRIEFHYTWMEAWGNASRPEGDGFGPLRSPRIPTIIDTPLSWDRRHSIDVIGVWSAPAGWTASWSTSIGSPLPWTPETAREVPTDPNAVNSRRLGWAETTNVDLTWQPRRLLGVTIGLEARNVFDHRNERSATLDGYPNPIVNTAYDDYGAYRTETGQGGGAYYQQPSSGDPYWVPVHDPRLLDPPRTLRVSVGRRW